MPRIALKHAPFSRPHSAPLFRPSLPPLPSAYPHKVYAQPAPSTNTTVTLLGEVGKICPHSAVRFSSFTTNHFIHDGASGSSGTAAVAHVQGVVGEQVHVAFFFGGRAHTVTCSVGAQGSVAATAILSKDGLGLALDCVA